MTDLLADLLADPAFFPPLAVRRATVGVGDDGRTAEDAAIETTIAASVQPATPEERAVLPEAVRDAAALTLWTPAPLDAWQRDGAVRFAWRGLDYIVQAVEPWPQAGCLRAVATVEAVPEGGS